ncbi:MAG: hypothetical protein JWN34_5296 [Bryobacterales bacterium]|nr:hypothetical protein [Bryobacterales bacterium]
MVLKPEADRNGCQVRSGIAKGLNGNVGLARHKIVQGGKDIDAVEHVRKAAIEKHAVNTGPDAEQMFPCRPLEGFHNFRVALRSLLIEPVALPQRHNAGNLIQGACGVRRERSRALAPLHPHVVDSCRTENGRPTRDKRMVGSQAAAPC